MMSTLERGTSSKDATNLTSASFALPSTGGAVKRIRTTPPSTPAISFLLARGTTLTAKLTRPFASLNSVTYLIQIPLTKRSTLNAARTNASTSSPVSKTNAAA